MNVLNYLNSKDARAHLQKLSYEFSPLDAAKIIENCRHIDLCEKHEAFSRLIAETKDEAISINEYCECYEKETTLHTLLKNYIAAENDAVQSFNDMDKDSVYIVDRDDEPTPTISADYMSELSRFINFDIEDRIVFTKKNLSTGEEISVCFNRSGNVIWVHDLERFSIPYSVLRLDYSFSENVPSPFVIGDVVIPCGKLKTHPIVITKFDKETILGYSLYDGRLIESELYLNTAELEYYPENDAPALKAVSDYIKGKSSLLTFINTYHKAALEEQASILI